MCSCDLLSYLVDVVGGHVLHDGAEDETGQQISCHSPHHELAVVCPVHQKGHQALTDLPAHLRTPSQLGQQYSEQQGLGQRGLGQQCSEHCRLNQEALSQQGQATRDLASNVRPATVGPAMNTPAMYTPPMDIPVNEYESDTHRQFVIETTAAAGQCTVSAGLFLLIASGRCN